MTKYKLLLFFLCFTWSFSYCQQTDWTVDESYNNLDWNTFVKQIEQNYPIRIFYKKEDVANFNTTQLTNETPLVDLLQKQLPDCNIAFDPQGFIFITKGIEIVTQLSTDIYPEVSITNKDKNKNPTQNNDFLSTTNEHIAKVIVIGDQRKGAGKSKITLNGVIKSSSDNSPLPVF